MIGAIVVGKPAATVITSSPFFIHRSPSFKEVSAIKAKRFAEEPELTSEQYLTPIYSAKSLSSKSPINPISPSFGFSVNYCIKPSSERHNTPNLLACCIDVIVTVLP